MNFLDSFYHFFDGLYNFEIVMLALGVLLFLVTLGKFFRGKPNVGLVVFFLVSIAMIGYPSVQSIGYKDGVLTIDKKVHDLEANPGDTALRASLQNDLNQIGARPSKEAATSVTLAQAHFALGNDDAAKTNLAAALQKNPELPAAKELDNKILLSERLKQLTTQVEANPNDSAAQEQLGKTANQVAQLRIANPATLHTMTKAQTILQARLATLQPNAVSPVMRNRLMIQTVPSNNK